MFLQPKTWKLIGKPPHRSLTFTQEYCFYRKNFFFVVGQHWCKATFFPKLVGSNNKHYYQSLAGQEKRKVNCGELSVVKTLLRLPDMVKAEFHPVFSTRGLPMDGRYSKREFRALYQ